MCNCVERALTLLRREHGNDELEIAGLAYSIGSENRPVDQPVDQFLTCCYSYRKRNKNGDFYKTKTKRYIFYSYCPFCGKKYDFETQSRKTNR